MYRIVKSCLKSLRGWVPLNHLATGLTKGACNILNTKYPDFAVRHLPRCGGVTATTLLACRLPRQPYVLDLRTRTTPGRTPAVLHQFSSEPRGERRNRSPEADQPQQAQITSLGRHRKEQLYEGLYICLHW
jgi:hypothetical protein